MTTQGWKFSGLALAVAAGSLSACGGGSDVSQVQMAKPLAVAPPETKDGVLVLSQVPAPGTSAAEVNSLRSAGVDATMVGCTTVSAAGTGSTGWPQYVVLVDLPETDVQKATALGFYEVRGHSDVSGKVVLDATFQCSTKNL